MLFWSFSQCYSPFSSPSFVPLRRFLWPSLLPCSLPYPPLLLLLSSLNICVCDRRKNSDSPPTLLPSPFSSHFPLLFFGWLSVSHLPFPHRKAPPSLLYSVNLFLHPPHPLSPGLSPLTAPLFFFLYIYHSSPSHANLCQAAPPPHSSLVFSFFEVSAFLSKTPFAHFSCLWISFAPLCPLFESHVLLLTPNTQLFSPFLFSPSLVVFLLVMRIFWKHLPSLSWSFELTFLSGHFWSFSFSFPSVTFGNPVTLTCLLLHRSSSTFPP